MPDFTVEQPHEYVHLFHIVCVVCLTHDWIRDYLCDIIVLCALLLVSSLFLIKHRYIIL